jgi:hypothetical protein
VAAFAGIVEQMAALRAEAMHLEAQAVAETKRAARVLQENLFLRTPVHTGETIRNYAWGKDGAPGGGKKSAIGSGPTGQTSKMPLGAEPRRAGNEGAVRAELENVLSFTRLTSLFVTNLATEKFDLVDSGSAPTPDTARNPGGVTMLAQQSLRASSKDWK